MKYNYKNKIINSLQLLLDQFVKIFPKKKYSVEINKNSKILIVKPDHLGDCLLAIESVKNILNTYKNIDLLLSNEGEELFRGTNFNNRTFSIRHFMHNRADNFFKKTIYFVHDYFKLLIVLKKQKYDVALLLRSEPGNLVTLSFFSKVKYIVGHETGGLSYMLDKKLLHNTDKNFELDNQKKIIESVFKNELMQLEYRDIWNFDKPLYHNYVLLLPNSGNKNKEVDIECWLNNLSISKNETIIIAGDRKNTNLNELLSIKYQVKNLSMSLNLKQLLSLIKNSNKVYCLDSFGAHFSSLHGKETIILVKNKNNNIRWGARGKHVKTIRAD